MIQRNSLFLMANLGSEVTKILSAKKKDDLTLLNTYLAQAHKILKEIMAMSDMKSREKELDTLSLVIDDIAKPSPELRVSSESITSYFTPFVLRLVNGNI